MAKKSTNQGVFDEDNYKDVIQEQISEIQNLYQEDNMSWIVGYSGGKDSTAIVQLIWSALIQLPEKKRHKDVYVITTDTLVENPIVSLWVNHSLKKMGESAEKARLPIYAKLLTPPANNSFWTNLIGRGYPAPRNGFRWCTIRLKIDPVSRFVETFKDSDQQVIIVIGTRKSESAVRSAVIKKYEQKGIRKMLSPHNSMTNAFVYAPIKEWNNDDVWMYLMQDSNPWGINNKDLFKMYRGASPDGECPLVIDNSTPSCGSSRFGCWVCTLVEQDRSMQAMIQNDQEKEWMTPLLNFRNELDFRQDEVMGDRDKRDFRRLQGQVHWDGKRDREIPGPYTQATRAEFLRKLLSIQQDIRSNQQAPDEVKNIDLITMEELHEIRKLWVIDKHETEDLVPQIYEEIFKESFPKAQLDDRQPFGSDELKILKKLAGADDLHFELCRSLLSVERQHRTNESNKKLLDQLQKQFKKCFYEDAEDARDRAKRDYKLTDLKNSIKQQTFNLDNMENVIKESKKELHE